MRAAVLYGKEQIRVEEIPSPPLQAGEVRITIEAALTCGTDLKVFKRGYHAKMIVPPAVFGHELSGVISELDREASNLGWRVGDRVVVANSAPCGGCFFCARGQENLCDDLLFLNGAYAESVVVPARIVRKNLLRLKKETEFRCAALTEPLACVVQGVQDSQLAAGQRVLVIGSGPIGLMFVAVATSLGCEVVLAGRGRNRLDRAQHLGAKRSVEVSANSNVIDAVGAISLAPFDAVIEAVGKLETWEAAPRLVRKGGLVNFFGGCPSGTMVSLDATLMHYSSLRLVASFHHTPAAFRRALELIESGRIRADEFIDRECQLSKLPELFQSMAAGNRAIKTLVRVRE